MSTWSAAPEEEPYADDAAIEADFEAPEADLAEQVRLVFVEEEKGRPSDDPEVAEADAQEQGVVVSLDEDSYR